MGTLRKEHSAEFRRVCLLLIVSQVVALSRHGSVGLISGEIK